MLSLKKITSQLFAFLITTALTLTISGVLPGIVSATGTDNVVTMGRNESGQLGIGTSDFNAHGTPNIISSLSGIVAVSSATSNSYAVKSDGTVWAWGNNNLGQIGDGTIIGRTTPVQVVGIGGIGYLSNVKKISGYDYFTFALKNDGTVLSWGVNYSGQLGNNTFTASNTPVQVVGAGGTGVLTDVVDVKAAQTGHAVALTSDGTVWAWGNNSNGQLGDGTVIFGRSYPVQVVGAGGTGVLTDVVSISAGDRYSVALKSDGTVWAWGMNGGNLGNGTTTQSNTPVQVVGQGGVGYLTDITAISAGRVFAAALKNDGTVWTWGSENSYGELGNGTHTASITPVQVQDSTGTGYLSNVTNIYVGGDRALAKTQDKKIWGWGENNLGQLGNGSTGTHFTRPVESTYLYGIKGISTGYNHTIAFSNEAPVVSLIPDANINGGDTYTANGSFTDVDSTSWTATVDYGEGAGAESLTLNPDKTFTLSHQYNTAGVYDVTVVITDDSQNVGTVTATVTVNASPQITAIADATIDENDTYTSSGSFTDTDSASWSATINYGDGSGTQPLTLNPDKTFTLSHQYTTVNDYTLTVVVTDIEGVSDTETAIINVLESEPLTITFDSSADTYVRSGQTDRNLGGGTFMRLQSSGDNRSLVQFDQTAMQNEIGNKEVLTAKLRVTITDNANNWGTTGRTIDVHRLIANWSEGDGTENDRGTGLGATWSCAIDSLIENQSKNCSGTTEWEMGQPNNPAVHPWVQTTSDTETITNNQSGVVEFDVTSDVASFLNSTNQNYGWIIKKTAEGQNGQVSFGTKESSSVPQLVVTYQP